MKPSLRPNALARPALHALLAVGFAAAFLWPIFALTLPSQSFYFAHAAWLLAFAVLVAISRSDHEGTARDAAPDSARGDVPRDETGG